MPINSFLRIHPRFMRSVHLERDLKDPTSSVGYVLTPVARQALGRITVGFKRNSTQRAWRIAGDYGCGKTAFGLALARTASGRRDQLPFDLQRLIPNEDYFPFVATGDNEPLAKTILRALNVRWDGRRGIPTTDDVLRAVHDAVSQKRRQRKDGVLLIIDELGKNLEHAARRTETDDVFLLQRLAEEACRSGDRGLVVVVMVHQAVTAYAHGLDSAARREWEKVAGRFEEIVFAQPLEQVTALVGATLNVDVQRLPPFARKNSRDAMERAARLGLYGASTSSTIADLGPKIYPIHPTALPAIVRSMRKFGQNERSLFSFISSGEPMGLQQHCTKSVEEGGLYELHHFFDYARNNLLPTLTGGHSSTHWGLVEAVLANAQDISEAEHKVLKTVALLNLLDAPDIPATEEVILASIEQNSESTAGALRSLQSRKLLYHRGTSRGLCLWPHTSVSLDDAFSSALNALSGNIDFVKAICERLKPEPLVPRGYYSQTGTLRFAEVQLVTADHYEHILELSPTLGGGDLSVIVVVPRDRSQHRNVRARLLESIKDIPPRLLIVVADPIGNAANALRDLIAWEWVRDNAHGITADRFAHEELTRQLTQAQRNLRVLCSELTSLSIPSASSVEVLSRNAVTKVKTGRELLSFIGEVLARVYSKSPLIVNELINRRSPSAAAVAARTKLVDAMVAHPDLPALGIDTSKRPAEMALYLSILKHGGFHTEINGKWLFKEPKPSEDACRLLPVLNAITGKLKNSGVDALVPVQEVFEVMAAPPFGIRDGLHPFIVAIYLAINSEKVSLYEDGTYLHEPAGDAYLRLMKEPNFFHLQFSEVSGVRAEVLASLLSILKLHPQASRDVDIFDFVRPLVVFVAQEIPEYARRTSKLSSKAIAVRKALLETREPTRLVFSALPQACAVDNSLEDKAFSATYGQRLGSALHELKTAYPRLIAALEKAITAAFGCSDSQDGRGAITERATQLAAAITEPTLKAFALRLADKSLDERQWVESVANFLARKSPERWGDIDEAEFYHQLEVNAARFKRAELAIIGTNSKGNRQTYRVALTRGDGTEVGELVHWDRLDQAKVSAAEEDFNALISKHGVHGLAATVKALWKKLETPSAKT